MYPQIRFSDGRVIAHFLGTTLVCFGVVMLIPFLFGLCIGETAPAGRYLLGGGLTLLAGALLQFCQIKPVRFAKKQIIFVTALSYLVCAAFAAIPLLLSGHFAGYLDAYFEGVSGLTASGLTTISDLDHLALTDQMWRFLLLFLGGQGVVVVAISLGLFANTGSSFYNAEGRDDAVAPNMRTTARFILRFAAIVVAIGTVALGILNLMAGFEPFRAFVHSFFITIGSYDTGGFAVNSLSIAYYHSWPAEVIIMLLMCLGAVNFMLFARLRSKQRPNKLSDFVNDIEIRTLFIWIVGLIILFAICIYAGDYWQDWRIVLRRGIFTVISAATNAGYQVLTSWQITHLLTSGAVFLLAIGMTIGGSSSSTAGGIKAIRVGIIAKGVVSLIKSQVQPAAVQNSTTYNHMGRRKLTAHFLSAALVIAALYVVAYLTGTLVGILCGYPALDALFESISAASNAGLSTGITSAGMPLPLQICYIVMMWAGRLEWITVLGMLSMLIMSFVPRHKLKQGDAK